MKKVISILAAAVLMLTATNAFAQLSVGAGYLNATEKTKVGSTTSDANSNGFYAGLNYNIPISGGFAVAPGLYYSALFSGKEFYGVANTKLTEHFVNIPLNFNLNFELAPDMTAFVYAGPTFQYGLASKVDGSLEIGNWKLNGDGDRYDNEDFSRTNVLIGGGVGMNVNAFQLTVGYDYGLLDLDKTDNTKINKSYIKLGVAYLF